MKESSDRSARAAPARRIATEPKEQELTTDDSFSEERFISPTSLPSWESSHSFDESEERSRSSRPSSRTSFRDRRKQFDTTTPTLIDEEYEREDEEEAEMISLEQARLHGYSPTKQQDEFSMRRTPGASMYKSSFEPGGATNVASMRRTPGASEMHQSRQEQETPEEGVHKKKAAALGFGLTLSTPLGSEEQAKAKQRIWESFDSHSASSSPTLNRSMEQEQPSRPPLAPTPATGATSRQPEARGPFSFTPWTRAKSPTSSAAAEGRSHGAFSPNILRLTEDIGNLLQEDEDDAFALEIPHVFRGDEALSEFSGDWAGSYVYDQEYNRRSKPAVPKSTNAKDGRLRRRAGSSQGYVPSTAQQPKPRRSGNEIFEFGKARDERESPQLLNFGGAFAPPPQVEGGSFMRPVASAPAADGSNYGASFAAAQQQALETGAFTSAAHGTLGLHSQSFDSYQLVKAHEPSHGHLQAPSPTPSMPETRPQSQASNQLSEMQATAREFVPMASMSPSPQPFASGQSWPPQASMHYDPSMDQGGSWHPGGNYFRPNYGYAMPGQQAFSDPRSSMTPSPHFSALQPPDPAMYGAMPQGMHPAYIQSGSASQMTASMSPDQSYREQPRKKKETKRGKRGKKKSKAEKAAAASTTAKKTSSKGDTSRPSSATLSQDLGDETFVSACEDPVDARRAELVETPSTRIAFKDFYRTFRGEEKFSFQKAEEFALQALQDGSVPETVHWRVYLELADLAKRSNRFVEARRLYQNVCQLQPYASQGWLEYSKLEEECGNMNRVTNILHAGLEYCKYSENLLTKAVKHQEKMGNLGVARELLARLKHVGIEKVWKTVLEGALVEARAGNDAMARRVLKYLMHHVPWYGPLYLEAYKLERDLGHPLDALHIVERGLHAIPRYGPLWFGAFRICEEMDLSRKRYHLPNTMAMVERATVSISKELVWKVHLEAAHMLERAALEQAKEGDPALDRLMIPARHRFALTILTGPHNLRWRVWLAAARMELGIGDIERARSLFLRAHRVVPDKGKSSTLLECVRLEEFTGDTELARAILCKARVDFGHDWKVWLESVLLEIRNDRLMRALEICTSAIEIHQGTGRLWAALVQLGRYSGGEKTQQVDLRRALNAVPKSGEVWCEGARIHLNPFSGTFDLDRARRHLFFATKFTPQYGDSFIEILRLQLLSQWLWPVAEYIWKKTKSSFLSGRSSADEDSLTKYITDVSLAISVARNQGTDKDTRRKFPKIVHREIVSTVRKKLKPQSLSASIDLNALQLACANADPNYGSLWFQCRRVPSDTPRRVIEGAAEGVADELHQHAHVYLAAMVRRIAILSTMDGKPQDADASVETFSTEVAEWERRVDETLMAAPSLKDILNPLDPTTGWMLLESTIDGSDFTTGLMALTRHRPITTMSLSDRRKALFGTDALFP